MGGFGSSGGGRAYGFCDCGVGGGEMAGICGGGVRGDSCGGGVRGRVVVLAALAPVRRSLPMKSQRLLLVEGWVPMEREQLLLALVGEVLGVRVPSGSIGYP